MISVRISAAGQCRRRFDGEYFPDSGACPPNISVKKKGNILRIKRGLYTDNLKIDSPIIANVCYSPSYISFETALSYYGMIPERVYAIKSATFMKNKKKEFSNHFGLFLYCDINKNAYPYDICQIEIENVKVAIASKEKALIDMISILSPRNNIKELEDLIFNDLRIDEVIFDELDKKKMIELCDLYCNKSIKILKRYLEAKYDQ